VVGALQLASQPSAEGGGRLASQAAKVGGRRLASLSELRECAATPGGADVVKTFLLESHELPAATLRWPAWRLAVVPRIMAQLADGAPQGEDGKAKGKWEVEVGEGECGEANGSGVAVWEEAPTWGEIVNPRPLSADAGGDVGKGRGCGDKGGSGGTINSAKRKRISSRVGIEDVVKEARV